jgi:hypothetical protein
MNEMALRGERRERGEEVAEVAAVPEVAGRRWLPVGITVLALAAGLIHLLLVFTLFRTGPSPSGGAPPSGGPPPGGGGGPGLFMYLPTLFVLNFVGFAGLALVFGLVRRASVAVRLVVDALLGLMSVATLAGWLMFRRPNPNGLGTLALLVELALLVAVAAHAVLLTRRRSAAVSATEPA